MPTLYPCSVPGCPRMFKRVGKGTRCPTHAPYGWPSDRPKMMLVMGPPCSGKTTYAKEHAQRGDVVIDFDDIREQISGDRYNQDPLVIQRARAIWAGMLAGEYAGTTWVIWAAPTRQQQAGLRKRFGARVVVMDTPLDTCLARAKKHRPPEWQALIRQWFAKQAS